MPFVTELGNCFLRYLSLLERRRSPRGARRGRGDEADVVELKPRRLRPRPLGRRPRRRRLARLDALLPNEGLALAAARNMLLLINNRNTIDLSKQLSAEKYD